MSTVMQRVVPQILAELDGFDTTNAGLLFIGATNVPWELDDAIIRPGRFDEKIHIPLPDYAAREQILKLSLRVIKRKDVIDTAILAQKLEGFSGADIKYMCEKASDIAYIEAKQTGNKRSVTQQDFEKILTTVKPSVSRKSVVRYEQWLTEK